jgi:hypothetical protein
VIICCILCNIGEFWKQKTFNITRRFITKQHCELSEVWRKCQESVFIKLFLKMFKEMQNFFLYISRDLWEMHNGKWEDLWRICKRFSGTKWKDIARRISWMIKLKLHSQKTCSSWKFHFIPFHLAAQRWRWKMDWKLAQINVVVVKEKFRD